MKTFDLHLHTDYYSSCSAISPEELIRQAVALKLDGIAVTEHGIRWPDDKFDFVRRLAEPHGLILIDAQEVQTYSPKNGSEGEYLVFGIKKSLGSDFSAKELVERVHGEGGILIAAHPYKWSRFGKDRYYGAGDRIYEVNQFQYYTSCFLVKQGGGEYRADSPHYFMYFSMLGLGEFHEQLLEFEHILIKRLHDPVVIDPESNMVYAGYLENNHPPFYRP